MTRTVKCPYCGGPRLFAPENRWRPFCSERCRTADLGAWAEEKYTIPGAAPSDPQDDKLADDMAAMNLYRDSAKERRQRQIADLRGKVGTCTAPTWVAGASYRTGNVVRYAPNGQYYIAEHDNPGYDPIISTWFWDPTTCPGNGSGGGGGGGGGSGGTGTGFGALVSRAQFESMFPNRNAFYTYDGLVAAAATFSEVAGAGDTHVRRREAAAFLANAGHETGDLVYIEEIAQGEYCAPTPSCPCAPGQRYFGRGPIQLSWNYNYCAAGAALGLDLRADPGRVAREATVAWRTGMWFWMTQTGAGSMTSHRAIVDGRGFGETIRTINGALECNGGRPAQVQSRIDRYRRYCQLLVVDPGPNLGC